MRKTIWKTQKRTMGIFINTQKLPQFLPPKDNHWVGFDIKNMCFFFNFKNTVIHVHIIYHVFIYFSKSIGNCKYFLLAFPVFYYVTMICFK